MPAIQVYKSKGVMIPVSEAKQAKAFVCPWTKEIYATKRSYVTHLKNLRKNRMHHRAKELRRVRKLEDLWNQPTFTDVIKWINLNPEVFWENAKRNGWASDAARFDKIRDTFTITILQLDLDYSDRLSNSHSRPHNGVTNWGGRDVVNGVPAPRGYPGFGGIITYKLSTDPVSFGSNVTANTRIHTGTGGIRGDHIYSYDVKFFLDDWPGIARGIQQEKDKHEHDGLVDMIKNTYKPYIVKGFKYRDPSYKSR